jgi:uncharacterized protein (TIGR00297 family)
MGDPLEKAVRDHAYVHACLHDHGVVRKEIGAAMERLHFIFLYGMTASIGFLGGALALRGRGLFVVTIAFAVLLPTLNFWFVEMIYGQIQLIIRDSRYCLALERRISQLIGQPFAGDYLHRPMFEGDKESDGSFPVGWETWVGGKEGPGDQHLGMHLRLAVGLFVLLSLVSVLVYVYLFPAGSLLPGTGLKANALRFAPLFLEATKDVLLLEHVAYIVYPLDAIPPAMRPLNIWRSFMKLYDQLMQKSLRARSTFDLSALVAVLVQALVITWATGWQGLVVYGIVIVMATVSTAYARSQKVRVDTSPLDTRSWKNSVANTGTASVMGILSRSISTPHWHGIVMAAFVASLGAGISDTLSHEIGALYGGTPRVITTFSRANPGDSGAVSLVGTVAGLVAAFGLAFIGGGMGLLSLTLCIVAGGCAFLGNLVDSVLGATLERRGVVDNNGVNAACTLSAAIFVVLASWLFLQKMPV